MKLVFKTIIIWILSINNCLAVLDFDGTDDYVDTSNGVITVYPFTFSAWMESSASPADDQVIVGLYDSSVTSVQYDIHISNANGYVVVLRANDTTSTVDLVGSIVVNDGLWHHIAAVYTNAISRELFVDGVSDGTSTVSKVFESGVDNFVIGRHGDSTPKSYFNGPIEDVRIYSKALSVQEIQELYKSRLKRSSIVDGSVGYWPLDECAEGQVCNGSDFYQDLSGNGNHGTGSGTNGPIGRQGTILSYP